MTRSKRRFRRGNRRFVLISTCIPALLFVSACHRTPRFQEERPDDYRSRTLLLPDQKYRIPDVEGSLLELQPEFYIEPGVPVDPERVDEYRHDTTEIVRESLTDQVKETIEELLFAD